MSDLTKMIYELLGSNKIFNTTKNELRSYLSDIDRDRLDARDRNYVVAMHRRIIIEQGDHEPRREHVEETPAQEKELSTAEWKDRAYKTMERAKRAEARVKELEQQLANSASSIDEGEKFQIAKRQFARMYHPDSVKGSGIEKAVRSEIFKEFWSILEEIEKSGNAVKR